MQRDTHDQAASQPPRRDLVPTRWAHLVIGRVPRVIGMVLAGLLAIVLVAVSVDLSRQPPRNLIEPVMQRLDETGVTNPVTGVLLNFRAYDTWLELGVLMLAMIGALALLRAGNLKRLPSVTDEAQFLPRMLGLFVPVLIVAGGYLLWRGSHAPGGAFQAGALAAAAGVMARLAGRDKLHVAPGWALRPVYAAAFALMLAFGLWTATSAGAFLEFPAATAGHWIFAIELAAAICIAITLWSLYVAAYPERAPEH